MKITTISANVRYSQKLPNGGHFTAEVGAEGSVSPNEDWKQAQAFLYAELGQQLKALWASRKPTEPRKEGEATQPTQDNHHCPTHGVPYKRFEKNGNSWYAHQHRDQWCNENRQAE